VRCAGRFVLASPSRVEDRSVGNREIAGQAARAAGERTGMRESIGRR
jgi:hypothetical protein